MVIMVRGVPVCPTCGRQGPVVEFQEGSPTERLVRCDCGQWYSVRVAVPQGRWIQWVVGYASNVERSSEWPGILVTP